MGFFVHLVHEGMVVVCRGQLKGLARREAARQALS